MMTKLRARQILKQIWGGKMKSGMPYALYRDDPEIAKEIKENQQMIDNYYETPFATLIRIGEIQEPKCHGPIPKEFFDKIKLEE